MASASVHDTSPLYFRYSHNTRASGILYSACQVDEIISHRSALIPCMFFVNRPFFGTISTIKDLTWKTIVASRAMHSSRWACWTPLNSRTAAMLDAFHSDAKACGRTVRVGRRVHRRDRGEEAERRCRHGVQVVRKSHGRRSIAYSLPLREAIRTNCSHLRPMWYVSFRFVSFRFISVSFL